MTGPTAVPPPPLFNKASEAAVSVAPTSCEVPEIVIFTWKVWLPFPAGGAVPAAVTVKRH